MLRTHPEKAELCVVGALRLCHGIDMERDNHRIAVSHFEMALEAHCNCHIALFLEVAAGQHIAIPVESAWIMLVAARDARPHKWMYARDKPEARYETGGLYYEVSPLHDSTLLQEESISCGNTFHRWEWEGDEAWLGPVDHTIIADPQPILRGSLVGFFR